MTNKILEVRPERGGKILIPKDNILFIQKGERGTNYIHLKEGKYPIETYEDFETLRAEFEKD